MSLFAAFSESNKNNSNDSEKEADNLTWLTNESFPDQIASISNKQKDIEEVNNSRNDVPGNNSNSNKKSNSFTKVSVENKQNGSEKNTNFSIDLTTDKLLLLTPYISKHNHPKYKRTKNHHAITVPKKRLKYLQRYFCTNEEQTEDIKANDDDLDFDDKKSTSACIKQEENITKTTAFYNRTLEDNPYDVSFWIKYVQFQDTVYEFEKLFKRGSHVKGARVTAERKLLIIDKALSYNPTSEELFRERILVAERVYPADELSTIMKALVDKDLGNVILWQGYIEATQCSMAHCSVTAVLELYKNCLTNFHQIRRSNCDKMVVESKILNILYQCGLFLRQAGLWELLWTLLKLYLELNVSKDKSSFQNVQSTLVEKSLVDLEEIVFVSNLPSHELWLRVEKLREACHWLPWSDTSKECEDPQRLVFNDDVAELIHPIICPENAFRLVTIVFTLLKIPLLPCRHTTMHELGFDYVPWSLDALELLLPLFYSNSSVNTSLNNILTDIIMFTVGPQYLRSHPGQEEYLKFVLDVMKNCASCLQDDDRLAIYSWWFSFQRLMLTLDKSETIKLSADLKKQIRHDIKDLLKQSQNRNNLILFREYALIEFEQGKCEESLKILKTTVLRSEMFKFDMEDKKQRTVLCSLYRTIVQLLLKMPENNSEKAVGVLVCLVSGLSLTLEKTSETNSAVINTAFNTFEQYTKSLLLECDEIFKITPSAHFLPDFLVDWIICNAWFLYLTRSVFEAGAFLDLILTNQIFQNDSFRSELLMECYVEMLHRYSVASHGSGIYSLLDKTLSKAIKSYPNNLYFLATLAEVEKVAGFLGRPWWKMNELLTESNHSLSRLFLVLLMGQRISQIEKAQQDAAERFGGPYLEDPSSKNRMLSLFKNLTSHNSISKRCGLLWRLYLKFLYHRSTMEACRNAYYAACEECPWLKALYIDAAIYIPTELPQIQDLLIEKQLRIHLTPEELEILRN